MAMTEPGPPQHRQSPGMLHGAGASSNEDGLRPDTKELVSRGLLQSAPLMVETQFSLSCTKRPSAAPSPNPNPNSSHKRQGADVRAPRLNGFQQPLHVRQSHTLSQACLHAHTTPCSTNVHNTSNIHALESHPHMTYPDPCLDVKRVLSTYPQPSSPCPDPCHEVRGTFAEAHQQ